MGEVLLLFNLVLAAATLSSVVLVLRRKPDLTTFDVKLQGLQANMDRTDRGLRDEIARNREQAASDSRGLREEVTASITRQASEIAAGQHSLRQEQANSIKAFGESLSRELAHMRAAESVLREEITGALARHVTDTTALQRSLREEVGNSLKSLGDLIVLQMSETTGAQRAQMEAVVAQIAGLASAVETRLKSLQEENSAKLDQMRQTVDDKLQGTLEKRLGESFRLVSERLEQVYRGLGEMQTLAAGVGDLKKVLTNVKTRGTWGEVQLGSLLEQVLTPDQYAQNVATTGTNERVEFAVRLPGRDDSDSVVWLPVDAKFPQEDYQRLVDAAEQADAEAVEAAGRQLEARIRACASDICAKYLSPPETTDFGILFLPTEGLYAEVLRRPGLADVLQREYRVVVAGPMTLTALLNSLQMGFRTLAIERRSSEVWKVLGAVKTEFQKYGEVLDKVRKKLDEASKTVDTAAVRTRAIRRTLRDVEELPEASYPALAEAAEQKIEELV